MHEPLRPYCFRIVFTQEGAEKSINWYTFAHDRCMAFLKLIERIASDDHKDANTILRIEYVSGDEA